MGWNPRWATCVLAIAAACGTGDPRVDPGALELRDLLGVSPATAREWDGEQRAGARSVLDEAAPRSRATEEVDLVLDPGWDEELAPRGHDVLAALARDGGHRGGPVLVKPAPRQPAVARYEPRPDGGLPVLHVNPVVLAAQEPRTPLHARAQPVTPAAAGNPYTFFGSIAECAFAQRTRCESCLPSGTCEAITTSEGNAECEQLAAESGRGYFLICANLAVAITSVERCTSDAAPGCPADRDAASRLAELANNAGFVDDPTCAGALDGCLAQIYGAPPDEFPGLDAGTAPLPPVRARDTNVGCSSDNSTSCESDRDCGEGPSCNNSLSCDSTCASSNDQSGCDGSGNACTEDEEGTGGGDGCGGEDGGGGDDGGESCGSSDGGDGGDGCGESSDGGDGGCSSGDDSGGSCNDSCSGGEGNSGCGDGCSGGEGNSGCGDGCSGGGESSSGCSSSGGGNSSCSTARRDSRGGTAALVISILWSLLPLPAAAWFRRRRRRTGAEVAS
jgi:hypothetical protein